MEIHSPVADNSRMTTEPTIYSFSLVLGLYLCFVLCHANHSPLFFLSINPNQTTKKQTYFRFATRKTNEMRNNFVRFPLVTTDFYCTSSINIKFCHTCFFVAVRFAPRRQIWHRQRKICMSPTQKSKFHFSQWNLLSLRNFDGSMCDMAMPIKSSSYFCSRKCNIKSLSVSPNNKIIYFLELICSFFFLAGPFQVNRAWRTFQFHQCWPVWR